MHADQQYGNKGKSRTKNRKEGCRSRFSDTLIEHINGNRQGHCKKSQASKSQSGCADADGGFTRLEEIDDFFSKDKGDRRKHKDDKKSEHRGKDQTLLDALVFLRLIVEGCYGLEALSDAKTDAEYERIKSTDDTHCGNGGISKGFGEVIEQSIGERGQPLTNQRREPHLDDGKIDRDLFAHCPNRNRALRHSFIKEKKNEKADDLRDRRCHTRAKDAHFKDTNEKIISENIEHSTCGQSDHGIECLALVTKIIIEDHRADQKGAGDEHPHSVVARVGKDRFGTSQKSHQRREKTKSREGKCDSRNRSREKRGGNVFCGFFFVFIGKRLGNEGTRAVSEHKCDGLNDRL